MVLILSSLLSFSQTGSVQPENDKYPKMVTINGDTLILITPEQVKTANVIYTKLKNCETELSMTESVLGECLDNVQVKNKLIQSKDEEIRLQDSIIVRNDTIIKELTITRDILTNNLQDEKKKTKFFQITSGTAGVVILILGILLIL